MTRAVFRFTLFALAVLFLTTALIRAQPYDDRNLRSVLMPEGCKMPCFMGIQPGITAVYDAVNLLESSGWAKQVDVQRNIAGWVEQVHWVWNGQQPVIFSTESKNRISVEHTGQTGKQLVTSITIGTTVPVAYAYLLLGDTFLTDSKRAGAKFGSLVSAFYLDPFVNIWSVVECPGTKQRFWEAPMTIDFMSANELSGRFSSIGFYCYVSGQSRR